METSDATLVRCFNNDNFEKLSRGEDKFCRRRHRVQNPEYKQEPKTRLKLEHWPGTETCNDYYYRRPRVEEKTSFEFGLTGWLEKAL